MTPAPQQFRWTGTAMVPLRLQLAQRAYTLNEIYRLAVEEERSAASHRQYFAALADAYANLPEEIAERWPSAEHLRKWALVKAGYCDERSIVCSSPLEAAKVAAFVRQFDSYAVITVQGEIVRAFSARSQSVRSMPKDEFQASKEKVLDIVAGLVGVTAAELQKNAEAVA